MKSPKQSLDQQRRHNTAHEYLVRLAETKTWLETNIEIDLPPTTELENYFRTGVVLARLANFFAPEVFPIKKIYDLNHTAFKKKGLHFKYSDNICGFIDALASIGFPKIFYPETTDIYDMKNIPKLVYCLHALSMYLDKLGIASPLEDLTGKVEFTDEEIINMAKNLEKYGIQMPAFSKIGGILAKELTEDESAMHAAIFQINEAIDKQDKDLTLECLSKRSTQLRHVNASLIEEYFASLSEAKAKKIEEFEKSGTKDEDVYNKLLTRDEIQTVLDRHNISYCLHRLTKISRNKDSEEFFGSLSAKELNVPGLSYDARDCYETQFFEFVGQQKESYIFNMQDIDALVKTANTESEEKKRVLKLIDDLNKGVHSFTESQLSDCLRKSKILAKHIDDDNLGSYLQMLRKAKREKISSTGDDDTYLWFNEIKNVIKKTNKLTKAARNDIDKIEAINKVASKLESDESIEEFGKLLCDLNIKGVVEDFNKEYALSFKEAVSKQDMESWNGWCEHKIPDYLEPVYYNYKTREFSWSEIPGYNSSNGYLNKEAIQVIIVQASDRGNKQKYLTAITPSIKLLQAYWRTVQLHKAFLERPKICLLGEYFKTLSTYLKFRGVVKLYETSKPDVLNLHSYFRAILAYLPYQKRVSYFMNHIDKIIALQSIIRAGQAHVHYHNIVNADAPTLKSLSKFAKLLEFDANDMREEIEISNMKRGVLKKIRIVNEKEAEIKTMDVKIGLLVKNRLHLTDILSQSRAKQRNKNHVFVPGKSKTKNEMFKKYGVFFYILQIYPEYCSKLIMNFIGKRNDVFITHTCYALFNYGANIRDEYSITKMFARSLQLEIDTNIDSLQEITKGDPLVIKMVINFYRNSKAQLWITELFAPIIKDVLNNKYNINTNAIEIYKQWVNSIETETGKSASLSYDVELEKALEYPEVVNKLTENIKTLTSICTKFISAVTSCQSKIPYGVKYIAKVMFEALSHKFPKASERDRLKIVGHILYFKLLNPVIVSPDLYDIATTAEITPEKRKNLASISVILQKSAYRSFDKGKIDSELTMNNFYKTSWKKFSTWYKACINVDEIDSHYNIDEYTDQSTIKRPELNLSVGQIIETHKLVEQYSKVLCPESNCVLFEALKVLGMVPSPEDLVDVLGKKEKNESEEQERELMKEVVIRLELIPPVVEESSEVTGKKLLSETVRLIADILQYYYSDDVSDLMKVQFTQENEESYKKLQEKRAALEAKMLENLKGLEEDVYTEAKESLNMTLKDAQDKLKLNLEELENLGMCKASDNYTDIIVFMAKEIKNRKQYRKNRRFDLLRLRGAIENLDAKEKYLGTQMESYETYIKACTQNLTGGAKKTKKQSKKVVAKFSAYKLHQRGVIIEIDGVNANQLKNVSFEISSTDDPGVFAVNAKLFGVSMETVNLVFEDLLQLQYEGVTVMKMFEKAKLNVNLLIFTINKKFFNKR